MSGDGWQTAHEKRQFLLVHGLPVGLAAAGLILYLGLALAGPGLGFPLDDSWIHLTYARNLAQRGELAFNPGQPSTGATSLSWLGLLALGLRLGIPPLVLSLALGGTAWIGLVALVSVAGRRLLADPGRSLLWASLCALSGHLLWFSLSGMETVLFLALGLGALIAYTDRRWPLGGVLMALLVLTRPEGIALPGLIALVEVWRIAGRRWHVGRTVWLVLPPLLAGLAFLAVNLAVGGQPLPTSYVGRRWIGGLPLRWTPGEVLGVGSFLQSWLLYTTRWIAGGDLIGWLRPEIPQLAWMFGAVLLALAGFGGGRGLYGLLRPERARPRSAAVLGLLFLGWLLAHNLLYVVFMPTIVHAGRYQALNYLAIPLGWVWALPPPGRRTRWLAGGLAGLLLALSGAQAVHWGLIYREGVTQINSVHVITARWIADHLPPGEPIAAYDIGALGFLSGHPIYDLSGLTHPEIMPELLRGEGWEFLQAHGLKYLARIEIAYDQPGIFARSMGFIPRADFPVERLFTASFPEERFWVEYSATMNASPSITIYRLP